MDSADNEKKLLRCDVCSRSFSFPETLANHRLMHETPVKTKTPHNRQKTKRANRTRTQEHHPYIRRTSPENVVPETNPAAGQNVAHEIVISDVSSPTWTYHVEPPKRNVIKDGIRYSSESVSWPYNPEYFKKFTEPTKCAQPEVFIPGRVTVCYNDPAKGFQNTEPVTSHCDDITWARNKIDECKQPINYEETMLSAAATDQASNTTESVPFSTANQTPHIGTLASPKECLIETSAHAQEISTQKQSSNVAVQPYTDTETRVSQRESPNKTPTTFSGNDELPESDKLYRCGLCWKTFSYLETLTNHMLGHRERAFCLCNVCGKEFDYLPNLDAHVTSHKPYRCIRCYQRFRVWKCAKEHAESHVVTDGGILEDYISYVS